MNPGNTVPRFVNERRVADRAPMAMAPEALPAFLDDLEAISIGHDIAPVVDRAGLDLLIEEVLPATRLAGVGV